jgi:pyruvate formate lyase activating enzyme
VTGWVFDIKHYSIHDGPGIRTTIFLKGCALRCLWCHNPEGIDPGPELMHWLGRCTRCYNCIKTCPINAIAKDTAGAVVIDRKICDLCGNCVEVCLYDAMQMVGRKISIENIMAEIEKDRVFYDQSGGGITLSGGDPFVQSGFTEELLKGCHSRGIHTVIETAGFLQNDAFDRLVSKTNLILFDLKCMDKARHRKYTGVSNITILSNLKRLASTGTEIWVRIPLIAGVNDDDDNIRQTITFLSSLKSIRRVSILPYHSGGIEKARRIGRGSHFRRFDTPCEERISAIEAIFREGMFEVRRGGRP